MLRRNGPVVKSVESVLMLERSLWGERFVEEVVALQASYSDLLSMNQIRREMYTGTLRAGGGYAVLPRTRCIQRPNVIREARSNRQCHGPTI